MSNKIRRSKAEKAFDVFNYVFLTLLVVVTAYPMIYVLFASISNPNQLLMHRGVLLAPLGFTTGAYELLFKNPMLLTSFGNTAIYVSGQIVISMLLTTTLAYVLSREQLYWKNTIMFLITFTMFFSGGMIPLFLVVKGTGLYNTRWAVLIPNAINAYNLIVMRTSLQALPKGLEESAKIDGASHFVIMTKVVIPLSMPVIAVITLYYAVAAWNGWFSASIYLRKRELYPLQLIVREILLETKADEMTTQLDSTARGFNYAQIIKYAVIVVSTLPILIIYPLLQKYFTKGVLIGAIKG